MPGNTVEIVLKAKDRASPDLKKVSINVGDIAKVAAKAGAVVVAATGAMAAGIFALASAAGKAGDEIAKMAKRTGASTEFLSAMGFAAERSGTSIQSLEKGLKRLSQAAFDATEEGGSLSESVRAFKALGVEVETSDGKLKSIETIFLEVADGLGKMESETARAALAQKVLGRAGTELLPLFLEGRIGIEELMEAARRYGVIVSSEAAAAAEEFEDRLTDTKFAIAGLTRAIGEQLIPILTPLIAQVVDVVAGIIEWVRANEALFKATAEIFGLYKKTEIERLQARIKDLKDDQGGLAEAIDVASDAMGFQIQTGRTLAQVTAELVEAKKELLALTTEEAKAAEELAAARQELIDLGFTERNIKRILAGETIKKSVPAIEREAAAERSLAAARKEALKTLSLIQKKRAEPEEEMGPDETRPELAPTKTRAGEEAAAFERRIQAARRFTEVRRQLIALGIKEAEVETGLAGLTIEQAELVLAAEQTALEGRAEAHTSFIEALSASVAGELETQKTLVETTGEFIGGLIEQTSQQFGRAFADMIVSGKDFGESFKELLKKVLGDIIAFLVMQIVKWVALTAAKALAGIPPGTPDPALASAVSAGGGAGGGGGLLKGIRRIFGFQHGGVVTQPTLGLVGEAGPEAIIPLDRLAEVLGGNITVNATFTGPISSNADIDQFGERLGLAIERGRRRSLAVA